MRIVGDCREVLRDLPKGSVQTCVTSPPYWGLRDYGVKRQIGLEKTPELFVEQMVEVFRLVREVLADDGTLWLNLGDSYAATTRSSGASMKSTLATRPTALKTAAQRDMGSWRTEIGAGLKPKDLCGMPWRVAFALQADGWYLRSDIIWHKPNPMPESVTDRPTKSHEYLFLLTKNSRYFYDAEAVREPAVYGYSRCEGMYDRIGGAKKDPERVGGARGAVDKGDGSTGRSRRTVWTIATSPFPGAHFATFPPKLVEPCILAGTSETGHCPDCGARWERVVEREKHPTRDVEAQRLHSISRTGRTDGKTPGPSGMVDITRTLGFRPTCTHNRKPVPDVCLDPFAGAGTTGMVAEQLGREFLGVELNPRYSKLAREAA